MAAWQSRVAEWQSGPVCRGCTWSLAWPGTRLFLGGLPGDTRQHHQLPSLGTWGVATWAVPVEKRVHGQSCCPRSALARSCRARATWQTTSERMGKDKRN